MAVTSSVVSLTQLLDALIDLGDQPRRLSGSSNLRAEERKSGSAQTRNRLGEGVFCPRAERRGEQRKERGSARGTRTRTLLKAPRDPRRQRRSLQSREPNELSLS